MIIAIESYPMLREALAGTLAGTLANAVAFREWLVEVKRVTPGNILFCSEPRLPELGAGATKKHIRSALIALRDAGAGDTEELYFFFSGHGFAQIGLGRRATGDVLLPSNFEDSTNTGDQAIKHDEIVNFLQTDLGPGVHFHFVDACRNERTEDKFPAGTLAIPAKPMDTGQATAHLLYSTSHGDAARVDSGFGTTLVEGLRGTAKAKTWFSKGGQPRKLVVRFESLVEFIRSQLKGQTPDADPGDVGNDLIYEFRPPIKRKRCQIVIGDADANDAFALRLGTADQVQFDSAKFQGSRYVFQQLPNDYFVEVSGRGILVEPSGWVPVDLYEDAIQRFRVVPGSPSPGPSPTPGIGPSPIAPSMPVPRAHGRLDLRLPAGSSGVLRNTTTEQNFAPLTQENSLTLPTGRYDLQVDDADGWPVRHKTIEVGLDSATTIDLSELPASALHEEILEAVPLGAHQGGSADFSESLGGLIADQDPALWLAIMGASHIVRDNYDFSKLAQLPLADFSSVPPGGSALYVLVGLNEHFDFLQLGLSNEEQPIPRRWDRVAKVEGFEHLSHYMEVVHPTPAFLSLALGQTSVITLTTAFLPNRATLVTVTQDRQGSLQVQQMMLPLGHLLDQMPDIVRFRVFMQDPKFGELRPLRNVKFIVQAQRTFRKRLALASGSQSRRGELNYLLYGKWLDPVMAALAAYELIRRGLKREVTEAVHNLMKYFPDFPDSNALSQIITGKTAGPIRTPLFLDGLSAIPNFQQSLPLPASRLDYRGMWTLWRGAVPNPNPRLTAIQNRGFLVESRLKKVAKVKEKAGRGAPSPQKRRR